MEIQNFMSSQLDLAQMATPQPLGFRGPAEHLLDLADLLPDLRPLFLFGFHEFFQLVFFLAQCVMLALDFHFLELTQRTQAPSLKKLIPKIWKLLPNRHSGSFE